MNYSRYPDNHIALRPLIGDELVKVLQQRGPNLRQVVFCARPRPGAKYATCRRWEIIANDGSFDWYSLIAWAAATREYSYSLLQRHVREVRERDPEPCWIDLFPTTSRGRKYAIPDLATLSQPYPPYVAGPGPRS